MNQRLGHLKVATNSTELSENRRNPQSDFDPQIALTTSAK